LLKPERHFKPVLKRLLAIALLTIHLFNIGGQLAFHQYMEYKTDKFFDQQISKNLYNVDELTEIKIPVDMPGITDWQRYQNLSGQVQFQNASYNYVKMKMTRHAIYLMCVPNYSTTHYSSQNIICAKQIADIPVPKKDHVPFGKINLVMYNYQPSYFHFSIPIAVIGKKTYTNHCVIVDAFITGPGQPPDTAIVS